MYADWNQDGTGETLVSAAASSATTTRSFTVTVPGTAKNGKTRLRVVMSDASATTACGSFSYGETEDYSITVSGGTSLVPTNGIVASGGQRLEVYPNPATDFLRLQLPGNTEPISVIVSDLRGVRVAGLRYADGQLDVSSLAKGMYTLSVSDGRQTYHQRFLKE